jgi:hypothetical protein
MRFASFKFNVIFVYFKGLIRETLRIAMSFLMALPTSSNGCRNLVRNAENADLYVIECFKLINEFSSQVSFDQVLSFFSFFFYNV